MFEEFYSDDEKIIFDEKDDTIFQVKLPDLLEIEQLINKILKFNNHKDLRKYLCIKFKNYKPRKNVLKVSQKL